MSMLKMKKENANNFCSISKDAPIQSLTKKNQASNEVL